MILGIEDLTEAEKRGILAVKNRQEWGAFSLDVRIDKLYRRKECLAATIDELDMPKEEYIDRLLEEVQIPEEGLVITPEEFYNWQPMEETYLTPGLKAEICSRSSWARLGVRVESQDEELRAIDQERTTTPLCTLKTTGTKVLLKKGDAVGQLLVHNHLTPYLFWFETMKLIEQGDLELTKENKKLTPADIKVHGEICLTMGPKIRIYTGGILVPGKLKDTDLENVEIGYIQPIRLPHGTFFISASDEHVAIPESHVGYVTERNSIMTYQIYAGTGAKEFAPPRFSTHANAPYIGPKNVFSGVITFENIAHEHCEIRRGMKQSEFALVPLASKSTYTKESRYKGQKEATNSRLS